MNTLLSSTNAQLVLSFLFSSSSSSSSFPFAVLSSVMGTHPHGRRRIRLFGLCAVLLMMIMVSTNAAGIEKGESFALVTGTTECMDCTQRSVKMDHAFKGLYVAIECKASDGKYETKAVGDLDDDGSFNVQLPAELLIDDDAGTALKHECLAQLYGASNAPCPDQKNGLIKPSKVILKCKDVVGKRTFAAAAGKLSFSSATCASAFFWPVPKWKWDPFHKTFPWHKHPVPPVYKPPAPVHKPPAPAYKPPAPVHKPPAPAYKPPAPAYKPPVPVYKPPPAPAYKKPPSPAYHKPPMYKFPPIHKKPLPPFPYLPPKPKYQLPPFYKKPFPHLPPKYKLWPPFPPYPSHP